MTLVRNLTAFSENAEYLAYSSPDGCLKIWETSTSILKQEYTPSSHLSATCSSLKWESSPNNNHFSKRQKKSKSENMNEVSNLQLIAMGTMTGDILLYSFSNADIHTCLNNGHASTVNDIAWQGSTLYTCSNDHYIIVWDICFGKIKTKWKANTGAVYSLCVIDDNNILSASSTIQWWDVKRKTVKKIFNGHGTEIFKLLPVTFKDNNYILSAAVGERVINVWQINENSSSSSVASLVLSDEPTNMDVLIKSDEPFRMSAVCQDGTFHIFEHILNGKLKKPLHPKFTVQIALKASDNKKPCSVPILAAKISNGLHFCLISYGNFLRPAFERIDISDISKDVFLIRNPSLFSSLSTEDDVTKIKQTEKPSDVKLLAPGHMINLEIVSRKRKKKSIDNNELPMEERLKVLDLSKTPKETSEEEFAGKSDSMVHLLAQGLQSKDHDMLSTVLVCSDELVIHNTIQRLPIKSIFPLLEVLHEKLIKKENNKHHTYLKWFTALISIHLSYFKSCKDISDYLIPFNELIAARRDIVCKMSQAHGVLKLLMSQVQAVNTSSETPSNPLLEYESESSSEESETERKRNSDDESDNEIVHDASPITSDSSDSDSCMEY